jgi:hypothetical protein
MANERLRKVFEDRLLILDALEALKLQAPNREFYQELLSDFRVVTTIDSMMAQLDELTQRGVAAFVLPKVNDSDFWTSPVRIREIDLEKLQALRQETLMNLQTRSPIEPPPVGNSVEESGQPNKASTQDQSPATAGGAAATYVIIVGIIAYLLAILAAVATWSFLKTPPARIFTVLGLIVLPIVLNLIYISLRNGRLSRWHAIELTGVGVLCICASVALTSVLSYHNQRTATPLPELHFVEVTYIQPQECRDYLGTGTIPAGYGLLIFDSGSPDGPYYLDGPAENLPTGGWTTPLVMAGNDPTYISAILVSSSVANFAHSVTLVPMKKARQGRISWIAYHLPLSSLPISPVKVWPTLNGNGCPSA